METKQTIWHSCSGTDDSLKETGANERQSQRLARRTAQVVMLHVRARYQALLNRGRSTFVRRIETQWRRHSASKQNPEQPRQRTKRVRALGFVANKTCV